MSRDASWEPATFERLYAQDPDPWRFRSSEYEREKYAATLSALAERRFTDALEVGCSIGVLTRQLAARSERLLAIDVADAALAVARSECAGLENVRFARRRVPEEWPDGAYDLIVLSEVLYFLGSTDLARTAHLAVTGLRRGGIALLVNWTGPTDTPGTGEAAATGFEAAAGPALEPLARSRGSTYRIDTLRRV
ncbi:MAG TPA: SAM-dependent methyltransferase [Acetobacteraceae bacterium]|jgi:SAM-dependent methyltransferase|nr:SAM-dependent methyltransferase [Acetobacteraceae bacterium]